MCLNMCLKIQPQVCFTFTQILSVGLSEASNYKTFIMWPQAALLVTTGLQRGRFPYTHLVAVFSALQFKGRADVWSSVPEVKNSMDRMYKYTLYPIFWEGHRFTITGQWHEDTFTLENNPPKKQTPIASRVKTWFMTNASAGLGDLVIQFISR